MPTFDPLRIAEHLHGHLGWLAAASLVHPALLLRVTGRRADSAVAAAVVLATLTGVLGVTLYPSYRETLRQPLFVQSPLLGYLFERKEHLAFGAIVLAWGGGPPTSPPAVSSASMGSTEPTGSPARPFAAPPDVRSSLRRLLPWPRRSSAPSSPRTRRSKRS